MVVPKLTQHSAADRFRLTRWLSQALTQPRLETVRIVLACSAILNAVAAIVLVRFLIIAH